ncbi:cytochrome o ubiquinol oxidase subunit IV [Sphingomonas lenta]|uniref:Cytochrome bo(3) ubiquinol oxidase subunit 4 n=1 Tax=Sphingomonas lenta TaxID=1141887 RepID=A0A2A2SFF8_9SPHN|nr:cytochrome o ubiquinol oxidase subunit IV [Sphingomonas lenta]PAX07968.1 cytochrome o ubiquinol oxidase subunit IV [Sphingomonas lenta]
MNEEEYSKRSDIDRAPGDQNEDEDLDVVKGVRGYVIGLIAASLLTAASFWFATTDLIYEPGLPVFLVALAIGQMGVHLVFFLHITTGPDNSNNVLALAFGTLIVALVLFGSIWIMAHLNHGMSNGQMHDMMRGM